MGLGGEADFFEGGVSGLARVFWAHAGEASAEGDELAAGHPLVEGILFGAECDVMVQCGVVPGAVAEDADGALAGAELAGGELEDGGLAGAVGSEQAGDSGGYPD